MGKKTRTWFLFIHENGGRWKVKREAKYYRTGGIEMRIYMQMKEKSDLTFRGKIQISLIRKKNRPLHM